MKSIADIKAIREKMQSVVQMRTQGVNGKAVGPYKYQILVCGGTGCESSNADLIYKNLIQP